MKKLFFIALAITGFGLTSCGNNSDNKPASGDTTVTTPSNAIDSAANNGVLPPSAAPGNAGNSSLADTTYKARGKDSLKK